MPITNQIYKDGVPFGGTPIAQTFASETELEPSYTPEVTDDYEAMPLLESGTNSQKLWTKVAALFKNMRWVNKKIRELTETLISNEDNVIANLINSNDVTYIPSSGWAEWITKNYVGNTKFEIGKTYTISVEITATEDNVCGFSGATTLFNEVTFNVKKGTDRYYYTFVALSDSIPQNTPIVFNMATSSTNTPSKLMITEGERQVPFRESVVAITNNLTWKECSQMLTSENRTVVIPSDWREVCFALYDKNFAESRNTAIYPKTYFKNRPEGRDRLAGVGAFVSDRGFATIQYSEDSNTFNLIDIGGTFINSIIVMYR